MIRVVLGSALPILGVVAVAAALVGPSLVAAPRGEPMLVASGEDAARLQPASFQPAECASLRLLALALDTGPEGVHFALRPVSVDAPAPAGALLIVLGPAGEIVGVSPAGAFGDAAAAMLSAGCYGETEKAPVPGAV